MRRLADWLAGAIVVVTLLGIPTLIYAYNSHFSANVITIHAHQWSYSPNQITVPVGEPVHLRVISDDVAHGFSIPDLNVNVAALYPGHPVDVTFTAPKSGKFLFYCIDVCGVDHGKMLGYILAK